ncbi:MAG: ATP-dependent DNA helicase RecG [Culicoidibacterales bacterium]
MCRIDKFCFFCDSERNERSEAMEQMITIPLTQLRGVGPKTQQRLNEAGLLTIGDLLAHFPYRYGDYTPTPIEDYVDGEKITLVGTIASPAVVSRPRAKVLVKFTVQMQGVAFSVQAFGRPYLAQQFKVGQEVLITGKYVAKSQSIQLDEIKLYQPEQLAEFVPVYSLPAGMKQSYFRELIMQALMHYGAQLPNYIPEEKMHAYKLLSFAQAVAWIHFPKTANELKHAKRTLKYTEFFLFELKLASKSQFQKQEQPAAPKQLDLVQVQNFQAQLPFELTQAQQKVVQEILADLQAPWLMNRLLQGDVGSGKTVVAALAMLGAVTSGFQTALMAPTEILAQQHYQSLQQFFGTTSLKVAILTGSTKTKQRRELLAALAVGEIDILIGTHALIEDPVVFAKLGCVVVDEQHRFGVKQRQKLRLKGENVDVLYMSATPIPRTLAMTAWGDMDVSVIDQLPAGRKPITTKVVTKKQWNEIIAFLEREVAKGRQAYLVCPLIEESETLDVQNAIALYETLQQTLSSRRIGLMHGRLAASEKDQVMETFKRHELDILVSTTVIEVGVNVPNATVMVIYDANRFGLSQLHQLRGRVGRGEHQSYCLIVGPGSQSPSMERLEVMEKTTDGFEIAQYDLEFRGPGDFFGAKQSGLPKFRLADLVEDQVILNFARTDAYECVFQHRLTPTLETYLAPVMASHQQND